MEELSVEIVEGTQPIVIVTGGISDIVMTLEKARDIARAVELYDFDQAHHEEFMDDDEFVGLFGDVMSQLNRLNIRPEEN